MSKHQNIAQSLLDAHVRFVMSELTGSTLQGIVESDLDATLKDAEQLTLNEVVTREMIKETVQRYAVELNFSAAIPELAGEIGRAIHAHEVLEETRLQDLMPDRHLEEFLGKLLELRDLREKTIRDVVANPVYAGLASDILFHGLRTWVARHPITTRLPGAKTAVRLGRAVIQRAVPDLEFSVEESVRNFVQRSLGAILKESENFLQENISEDTLRHAALDLWQDIRQRTLGSFRDNIDAMDVEEFFVIVYEYWHELRDTRLYSALINAGIDAFFDKYGDTSLRELLREIGISRDMMVADAMRFAPHVIGVLKTKGLLEPLVRRELTRFYVSGEVERVLEAAMPGSKEAGPN